MLSPIPQQEAAAEAGQAEYGAQPIWDADFLGGSFTLLYQTDATIDIIPAVLEILAETKQMNK